jgi:OOP family OmpA-OmpF porin
MKNYFLIVMLILVSSSFAQNGQGKMFNPLSSKASIGIDGGITYPKTDFKQTEIDYIVRLLGDYYFPTYNDGIFGLSVAGAYGYAASSGRPGYKVDYPPLDEFRTQMIMLSGGLSYTIKAWNSGYPYFALRAGWINYQPRDVDGNDLQRNKENIYSPNDWFANGELGIKFMLSNSVSLNIAGTMDYLPFDNLDDSPNSITGGSDNDIFFTLTGGLQFYFGGISDNDNDGVEDDNDMCPDTPPGVKVDKFGCAVDTDKDGVPDYLDKCPNTPKNISVDLDGCPLDVDGDRVPDYMDLCNDTPVGVAVDSRGCPSDSDDDGVPDFKDLCANTPVGTEVNKWGCPIDEEVFEPITKTEFVLSGGINFESGKSDLLPSAYPELDKVLKVMKDYPETKWKIEGHTDNTGSQKLNKDLSINRAKSVYNYFTRNGIAPARLSYNGYGPDYPIGDNSTETGKALNRRVAIVLVSDDETEAKNITAPNTGRIYNVTAERNVGQMIFTDGYLYCVQVSSWRARAKAESEAMRLESEGYNSFIVIADLPELDGTWYRVRVGYFNTFDEANRVRERVK